MKKIIATLFAIISLFVLSNSWASENDAIAACENKIRSIYDVDRFKNVAAEKTGHHKYEVHGKVKFNYSKYPFNCNVKRGSVRSYHYEGPTKVTENTDNHHHHKSHAGRNVAIGVGIAAVVAMAIANSNKKDSTSDYNKNDNNYSRKIDEEDLEDSCHDAVDGRIKKNYHTIRRVNFKHDSIQHDATKAHGDGRIAYYNGDHTNFSFSCNFDHHGRVIDSSYSIY